MAGHGAALEPRQARERDLRPLGPRGEGWIGIQMLFEIGAIVLATLTAGAWSGPLRVMTTALGLVLLATGVLVFAWGASTLGSTFSVWVTPRSGGRLATGGPYRYSRHPICTAQVLLVVGWSLAAASLVGLVLVPVVAWYLDRFKLAREEQTLLARYPEYAAYMAAVPHRMLPVPPRDAAPAPPPGG